MVSGILSRRFTTRSGVNQGGIISPVLFCIYMDNLLMELQKQGIGCYIGCNYLGVLAYADDIILLCPSVNGTKKLCVLSILKGM